VSLPAIAKLELRDDTNRLTSETVHKTYAWDFEKGDFILCDGKLIELTGLDYIKVWIQKAIRTVFNSKIYVGTNYGSEHHSLIGRSFNPSFSQSEYERMIREAMMQNDAITSVSNFSFHQSASKLNIEFDVQSIYGSTREEAMI